MGYITTKPTNNMGYIRSWVSCGARDTWWFTEAIALRGFVHLGCIGRVSVGFVQLQLG